VRQVDGFKNVSLGNVLSARDFKDRISFLGDDDQEAFKAYAGPSFEVQVGLHELLGHGSGKLFIEDEAGGLNFDPAAVVNPLAPAGGDASIKSWYKAGASWDTVFGPLASAMEECRAEAVGIFLCVQPRVLEIFGHPGDEDLVYVNWLNMARAGLLALQYYNTASRSWGQAHMQARYALLRVMLEAGGGLVSVEGQGALSLAAVQAGSVAEGEGGVHVRLDRTKIRSVGVPAVGAFLRRLQVYKSTADVEAGTRMFNQYCEVPEPWLALRALVVAKRKPRQMLVQPVIEAVGSEPAFPSESTVTTSKAQGDLQLRDFPATAAGIVDSFAHRFRSVDHDLLALWRADQPFFGADA
jgi:dipeptidyl-peptidase-3